MEKEIVKFRILFFASVLGLLLVSCSEPVKEVKVPDVYSISGTTMGTTYSIKIVQSDSLIEQSTYKHLKFDIDNLLKEVNRQMSTYIANSEISTFNAYMDTNWYPISKDFAEVVETALYVCAASDSSLDITVGALVNLWGFGPQKRANQVPDSLTIEELKSNLGFYKILVRTSPPSIKKRVKNISIDLSAIAKGFGVDKVSQFLDQTGISNYMVEIGGEVRTKNLNQHLQPWKIGISTPSASTMSLEKVVDLSNLSMATSGDYRNYFEVDGVRYSHTIDPKTGYPITHNLASVSVIANNCMIADAYATAIDVMGSEKGLEFAKKMELPIFMIVHTDTGFQEIMNDRFKKFITNSDNGEEK